MNSLKKQRVKTTLKYTWPIYIIAAIIVGILLNFLFVITHRPPAYQTLTIFVSGEVESSKKLENYMLEKFKDYELKTFSCIAAKPEDSGYNTKLSVAGYNSADMLIIPVSKLDKLVIDAFAIELTNELISSYYQGYSIYQQESKNYGVKIDSDKVKDLINLPSEDCYMVLNARSMNIGEYSTSPDKSHDMALKLVQDWGM